jgi:hypothetical protein
LAPLEELVALIQVMIEHLALDHTLLVTDSAAATLLGVFFELIVSADFLTTAGLITAV